MKGIIFSVKRYAIHDGPGIRVTFFMKGCPLSCHWCHNPEGISPEPEEIMQLNRIGAHEFSRKELAGRTYGVDEVLAILEKERIFIDKSGGGVTFSGGEPFMQHAFLLEALKACKLNGYHTAVDTSGQFTSEKLDAVLPYTDLFLFDLKHLDPARHKEYTGVTNELIMRNFKRIIESNAGLMIRIPVIPGFNDDPGHMARMMKYINENMTAGVKAINLLPYHRIGLSKYRKLNRPFRMENVPQPASEKMNELKELFSAAGARVKIGG
jgi:pyruvate formate lyase activating enzyme